MGYVYCLKHLPTEKLYIGSRTKKNCDMNEFFKGEFKTAPRKSYWTSSPIIHKLLETDGKESFEIIFCRNSQDAYKEETELLLQYDAKNNSKFLNRTNNFSNGIWSPSNHIWINNGIEEKYIHFSSDIPAGFAAARLPTSSETNLKKGKPGKRWYNDGTAGVMLYDHENTMGLATGRLPRTKKWKKDITCPHCCSVGSSSNMKRYHFDNCELLKNIGEYCVFPRILGCSKIHQCNKCGATVKGLGNLNRWHNDNCKSI